MDNKDETINKVVNVGGVESIQLLLIYWKLVDYQPFGDWTWWMILSPTFLGLIFGLLFGLIYGIFAGIANIKD